MSSQQGKLLRMAEKVAAGKTVTIKVAGVPTYHFVLVRWGGTSPTVVLRSIASGEQSAKSAAEWKRLGVSL